MVKLSATAQAFYDPTRTYDVNFEKGPYKVIDDEITIVNSGEPRFSFLGQPVYSPFGIAAGPLLNSRFIRYAFDRGFDVSVYKTQRSIKFDVNQFPNVLYLDIKGDLTEEESKKPQVGSFVPNSKNFSITNSFGNPSKGPEFWVGDVKRAASYQSHGQILIASVVGTIKDGFSDEDYFDDFAESAELANKSGVLAIEINLSCPNVANEGILCYTPKSVISIVKKVKDRVGKTPVIVKFGYFSANQQKLLEDTVIKINSYISAISAINTIPAPVVDKEGNQALPGPNRLVSGVCGPSIKWAGLDMVSRLHKLRKKKGMKFEIIGVGGVRTVIDFDEYRKAGADVVQCATGAMWNPGLALEIKRHLNVPFEAV